MPFSLKARSISARSTGSKASREWPVSARARVSSQTEVRVQTGDVKKIDIRTEVASQVESIMVTADRPHGEVEAIERSRNADNVVQVGKLQARWDNLTARSHSWPGTTPISNLSGMLDLGWRVPGQVLDDTPPESALIFSLWRENTGGGWFVKLELVTPSLDQMRRLESLTLDSPPARVPVPIPACGTPRADGGCPWAAFRAAMHQAIDPQFTGDSQTFAPSPLPFDL